VVFAWSLGFGHWSLIEIWGLVIGHFRWTYRNQPDIISPMVQIDAVYEGDLRCKATHAESGATLSTDAPKDNQGKGESFSPTDLVATALGTCMLTTMGIVAKRHEINFTGAKIRVRKEMVSTPVRRIGKLTIEVSGPASVSEPNRLMLERAAITCPVAQCLHPDVQTGIVFHWGLQ
jgi:putative redox protein